MPKHERGLGMGLGAILGGNKDLADFRSPVGYINKTISNGAAPKEGDIRLVPIVDVVPNPYQPRITFDQEQLEELSRSIVALGLIQPITVRTIEDGKYQIISGERRFRACKLAGIETIPAYVRTTDDAGMLELAIVENVQRANLDPIETAMSYKRLIDECKLTQEQMADRIGKSRVAVTNMLRLLKLPAKVQYDVKVGNISTGHAKVLLGVEDVARQESLTDTIIRDGLSVRALEDLIRSLESKPKSPGKTTNEPLGDKYEEYLRRLGAFCSQNVSLRRTSSGKGTLTLRFENDGQLDAFMDALKK